MRIVTRIRASAVLAVLIAVAAGVVLLVGIRSVGASIDRAMDATGTLNEVFQLSMLTTDYLINSEPRAERQWNEQRGSLDEALGTLVAADEADRARIARLRTQSDEAGRLFAEIVTAHDDGTGVDIDPSVTAEYRERLTARLLIVLQSMVSDATTLAEHASAAAQAAQQTTFLLVLGLAVGGIATMVIIGTTTTRTVVRPLVTLRDNALKVGRGDLDVRSGIDSDDEVGELASAFDGMVADLKQSYALLETEIGERRRAEHSLGEYRDHLEQLVAERTSTLMALNEELVAATRTKDEFMAAISHELRTPLNSIIGFTDIILKGMAGPVSDEQRRQLGMVLQAGQQLLGLIEDVLDLARIERGAFEPRMGPCSVETSIGLLMEMMEPLAMERGLTLTWHMEPDAPQSINTDRGRLHQIMLNLVSNAIKFTDAGSVDVAVRRDGVGRVMFEVTDTGIGIPADELGRVFDHFYQAARDPATRRPGAGLGLAISQRLAETLGGSIAVTSVVGKGSTFTLTLPESSCA